MSKVPGGPGIPSAPGSPGRPSGPLCEQKQLAQFINEAFLYKTIAWATAFFSYSLSIGLFPECNITPIDFFFFTWFLYQSVYCAHLPGVQNVRSQLIKAVSHQSSPNNTNPQPSKEKIIPPAGIFSFVFQLRKCYKTSIDVQGQKGLTSEVNGLSQPSLMFLLKTQLFCEADTREKLIHNRPEALNWAETKE